VTTGTGPRPPPMPTGQPLVSACARQGGGRDDHVSDVLRQGALRRVAADADVTRIPRAGPRFKCPKTRPDLAGSGAGEPRARRPGSLAGHGPSKHARSSLRRSVSRADGAATILGGGPTGEGRGKRTGITGREDDPAGPFRPAAVRPIRCRRTSTDERSRLMSPPTGPPIPTACGYFPGGREGPSAGGREGRATSAMRAPAPVTAAPTIRAVREPEA